MKYWKAWIVTAVSYFVIDLIGRMFILGPISAAEVKGIMKPFTEVNKTSLMLEYLLMPTVLVYLLVETGAVKKDKLYSFKLGTIFGFAVLGMYEIVNTTLLLKWTSAGLSVVNAVGGGVIVGLTALVSSWALKKFNSK